MKLLLLLSSNWFGLDIVQVVLLTIPSKALKARAVSQSAHRTIMTSFATHRSAEKVRPSVGSTVCGRGRRKYKLNHCVICEFETHFNKVTAILRANLTFASRVTLFLLM
jgi:hypothetical protein